MVTPGRRPVTHRDRRRPPRPRRLAVGPDLILSALGNEYGWPKWRSRLDPVAELVFTVLTQHTSDHNAEIAYRRLRQRFPTWEAVIAADSTVLADTIRSGGLANQKAPRIQAILTSILERRGWLSLDFLRDLDLSGAKSWLRELPGVGPKTAAVVLAFSLDMPAMPVDTHVFRVARRLGLITKSTTVEQAHDVLEGMVDPAEVYAFHVLLITHGRQICKARRPRCEACPLRAGCPARSGFEPARQGKTG